MWFPPFHIVVINPSPAASTTNIESSNHSIGTLINAAFNANFLSIKDSCTPHLIQTNEYIPVNEPTVILDHLASVPELTVGLTNDDLATEKVINKMNTVISEPTVNPDHVTKEYNCHCHFSRKSRHF